MAMISAQTYLEHIKRDGARIPEVAEGHLDASVPSCPGLDVKSLLLHVSTLYLFWSEAILQNQRPEIDWAKLDTDVMAASRDGHAEFLSLLSSRDPDQDTWTWAGPGKIRFWYRRAAQELAVHRWDFENAVGDPRAIDPTLAADGIDELLLVFGPATGIPEYLGASERFAGNGETFRLEPTDLPDAITFIAHPDRFEMDGDDPDVTARARASDLLLFLWGRVPHERLDVSGDATLLKRWQEDVKI
jgi:uncharacterized protein (TIGR03083 family)